MTGTGGKTTARPGITPADFESLGEDADGPTQ